MKSKITMKRGRKISEEIMAKNPSNYNHTQAHYRWTAYHQRENLESSQTGKRHYIYTEKNKIVITDDFSTETMEARRQWNTIINVPNDKTINLEFYTSENNLPTQRQNENICKIKKKIWENSFARRLALQNTKEWSSDWGEMILTETQMKSVKNGK